MIDIMSHLISWKKEYILSKMRLPPFTLGRVVIRLWRWEVGGTAIAVLVKKILIGLLTVNPNIILLTVFNLTEVRNRLKIFVRLTKIYTCHEKNEVIKIFWHVPNLIHNVIKYNLKI